MKTDDRSEVVMMARTGKFNRHEIKLFLYWLLVGIPLSWGIWNVITQSLVLFGLSSS